MSGDWSESLDWDDDVPELTMAEAEKAFEAGARLVRDRATFAALWRYTNEWPIWVSPMLTLPRP